MYVLRGEDSIVEKEGLYNRLLISLSRDAVMTAVDGLPVEVRNCEDRIRGELDPRTALTLRLKRDDFEKNFKKYDAALWPNGVHLFGPRAIEGRTMLEILRLTFGWVSEDISEGVRASRIYIESDWGPVAARTYEHPAHTKKRPCLLYFHGGGFFGGDVGTVENQGKLIARRAGALVVSVDYPLAPENQYPIPLDCCYAVLEWVHTNAAALGIDGDKIAVAGDSAGANLALACALRNRDEGTWAVAYQALIYPALSRAEKPADPYWYWTPDAYENPSGDPVINEQIRAISALSKPLNRWYIPKGTDPYLPYLNPISAPAEGLPKTTIMTAEYDFLRMECEEYSRILMRAGVTHRHIRYGGITHGTFDRLGYAPQVEDMINEIVKDIVSL
jgi:acetyl esterase/lipase